MQRMFLIAAVALLVSGCDMLSAISMSRAEKVNSAFPLPEDVITAQNSMFKTVTDEKMSAQLKTQYAQVLEVRALTCSSAVDIGRLTSVAEVRKRNVDTACLREQSSVVADWIGLQRFIFAVRQPPLVPLAPLTGRIVVPPTKGEGPAGISMARAANVAVISTDRGSFATVELPSGKVITTFPAVDRASSFASLPLSANGRVMAMRASDGGGIKMVDVESGTVLWTTRRYGALLAWLPELDASIFTSRDNSAPILLDHRTGKSEPYAIPVARPTWATPMPGGSDGRLLIGDAQSALMIDNSRGPDGTIGAGVAKQWRLAAQGVTSYAPIVMAGGRKIVYLSVTDLAWLDLTTDQQGIWTTSVLNARGFARINETSLYIDSGGVGGTRSWLFDIEKETVTPVARNSSDDALLLSLGVRDGYARRGFQALVIGTSVATEGEPTPLDKLIADRHLEQQLARLNQPALAGIAPLTAPHGGMSEHSDLRARAAAAAAAHAAALAAAGREVPASVQSSPLMPLQNVPANAHVSVVGVYEPRNRRGAAAPDAGVVRVKIAASRVPLVLVLSNYESVEWRVQNEGRPIAAVLVSGYEPATVTGVQGKTIVIGRTHAYKMTGAEFPQLRAEIARYVPNSVRLFQGTYAGAEFSIPSD
jgi:outer membrane protein assembly factor BamB